MRLVTQKTRGKKPSKTKYLTRILNDKWYKQRDENYQLLIFRDELLKNQTLSNTTIQKYST